MRLVATVSSNFEPLLDDQAEAISTALRTAIETASNTLLARKIHHASLPAVSLLPRAA